MFSRKKDICEDVVTVDGPSGSGKGTISELLAEKLHYHYLDSGALYRVLGFLILEKNLALTEEKAIVDLARGVNVEFKVRPGKPARVIYQGQDISYEIRSEEVASMASQVAANHLVREALLAAQRNFCREPGLVADGRDMGTVVFPKAKHKFYILATPYERARRRLKQLQESGKNASLDKILDDIKIRDARDSGRKTAPLKPAQDAIVIDTTKLTIDEVIAKVMEHLNNGQS